MMALLGFAGSALVAFREILESVDIQPQQSDVAIHLPFGVEDATHFATASALRQEQTFPLPHDDVS